MPDSVDGSAELRLLHWNIHSWRDASGASNAAAVAALIRETAPHVVSLVEVNEPWGAPDTLADVASACGYSWLFVPAIEFGTERSARGYGNALLTRVPVIAVQQLRLFSPERGYDGTEQTEIRSVLLARLALPPAPVWLGSTHLPATDRASRRAAAGRLGSLTSQLTRPWIVCGDFNAPPALFAGRDITVSPETAESTFPASRPTRAIDYCLASPGVGMKAEVLRVPGSDHLPVLAVARLGVIQATGRAR